MQINRMSDPLVTLNFDHMTMTLDFQGQILKELYLWNGGGLFIWNYVTLKYDLDLGFSRSNFEITISQEWVGQLT